MEIQSWTAKVLDVTYKPEFNHMFSGMFEVSDLKAKFGIWDRTIGVFLRPLATVRPLLFHMILPKSSCKNGRGLILSQLEANQLHEDSQWSTTNNLSRL